MGEPLHRVAVLTHYLTGATAEALAQLSAIADRLGLELLMPSDEVTKHPGAAALGFRPVDQAELRTADLCLVFGGDGTILRSLSRLLGTQVPTLGVNYGNVGFLASLPRDGWQAGLETILAGGYRVVELLTVDVTLGGEHFSAVNDVILSRVAPRHVLQLEYEVAGVAHRLHRVQPLVQRADRRVERRRARAQLHRPALAGVPPRHPAPRPRDHGAQRLSAAGVRGRRRR